jgi:hypothetical protein
MRPPGRFFIFQVRLLEVVRGVYELAGGEHEQFEAWFINYPKTVGSFNKNIEAQVSRYLRLDGQTPADEFRATLADTLLCRGGAISMGCFWRTSPSMLSRDAHRKFKLFRRSLHWKG